MKYFILYFQINEAFIKLGLKMFGIRKFMKFNIFLDIVNFFKLF